MYLVKTPKFIKYLFSDILWRKESFDKTIYLTFDDGPIPIVTPWVLEQLEKYSAKATFFCVGDNVVKHPDIYQKVLSKGHKVGNHTFNHLDAWDSDNLEYYANVKKCADVVNSNLFRPPYGRLTPAQIFYLQKYYKIVLWDVLSGDFDQSISKEQCLQNVIKNTENGSIIVLHDSLKAQNNIEFVLPRLLEHFHNLNYTFEALDNEYAANQRVEYA